MTELGEEMKVTCTGFECTAITRRDEEYCKRPLYCRDNRRTLCIIRHVVRAERMMMMILVVVVVVIVVMLVLLLIIVVFVIIMTIQFLFHLFRDVRAVCVGLARVCKASRKAWAGCVTSAVGKC